MEGLKIRKSPKEQSPEENFRLSLRDVIDYAEKLAEPCGGSIDEMLKLCKLGMESDAQARILMALIGTEKS